VADFQPVSDAQLRALTSLHTGADHADFYLAGGTAIAFHLRHRQSRDLDLFSYSATVDLERFRMTLLDRLPGTQVIAMTDVSLRVRAESLPIDVVRYPYAPLEPTEPGPAGFPTAGLLDLASMKLSAVSRRGIRRDFWDLQALMTTGALALDRALEAYQQRFGLKEADLYHVLRSLTYFDDAERETVYPQGLDVQNWNRIKEYFRKAATDALARLASL
jgi:hypothetical protein